MIFSLYYIAIACTLLALLGKNAAGSKIVIDEEELVDISIVSGQLCDSHAGQDLRISRISTISKLHNYFESLADTNQAACREFYLEPLADLRAIVETGNANICSAEMMEQLDHFHWHYVVGSLAKKWRKASNGTLPDPLRTFFINYSQLITEKCKDTLLQRLTTATSGRAETISEAMQMNKFGTAITMLSKVLYTKDMIKKHDDFLLLWNQFIDKERRRGRRVEFKTDQETGEVIYDSFRVSDPEKVWAVQRKCRQDLRPIYRETVLPIMRFISIGYGTADKYARADVSGSETVKDWYAITQLCELILPVNFYPSKTLQKEQTLLLTKDESNGLAVPEESQAFTENSSSNLLTIQPALLDHDILPNAESDQMADLIKSNMRARSHVYRRVARNTLGMFKSILKNLFISKKVGEGEYVAVDGESVLGGKEKELLRAAYDDDDDGDDTNLEARNKPESLVRHRRDWTHVVSNIVAVIFIGLYWLCICVVVAFVVGLAGTLLVAAFLG